MLAVVGVLSCSGDDSISGDDGENTIEPPTIETPEDSIRVQVKLKGRVRGNVALIAVHQHDPLNVTFDDKVVDTTLSATAYFKSYEESFTFSLGFNTMGLNDDPNVEYVPAEVKIKTYFNDEIRTDMDTTIVGPTFSHDEKFRLE